MYAESHGVDVDDIFIPPTSSTFLSVERQWALSRTVAKVRSLGTFMRRGFDDLQLHVPLDWPYLGTVHGSDFIQLLIHTANTVVSDRTHKATIAQAAKSAKETRDVRRASRHDIQPTTPMSTCSVDDEDAILASQLSNATDVSRRSIFDSRYSLPSTLSSNPTLAIDDSPIL